VFRFVFRNLTLSGKFQKVLLDLKVAVTYKRGTRAVNLPMLPIAPKVHSWITRPCKRPQASLRLFCFPRAGGGTASFRGWAEDIHPEIEVALIHLPGRESRLREESPRSMERLVPAIVEEMAEFLDRPYAVYGHSLGAKVAFETVRELRRRKLPAPVHLFAAASAGPGVPWIHPLLHGLDDFALLREIQRRYGGVPQEVLEDKELCALLIPALRADVTVVETYRYAEEPPLANPITCFCGTEDFMTPESEAVDWQRQTSAGFRLHRFPGDHFFPVQGRSTILDLIAAEFHIPSGRSELVSPGL
jgi:medium-chain acyl-[acyl-carrier-protein] hydrolase